ncbi:hypothetical protein [Flavobacterium undicola]|uniref:hypothetical protein n=1 Tax=Flavobacterium undicola TaxID=1932779 RepID=UPI001378A602|nr:hypothetical protein [Flavobacterium undicola]MBA0883954.1 hypothetical protein [Flavobacterium undicola]
MKKAAYLCIVALVLVSCNKYSNGTIRALDEAGENKQELEKVFNFYETNPADSLKYKAALFLVENMSNHYSHKSVTGFEDAFDSISNYPMDGLRRGIFEKMLDSVSKKISLRKSELIPDVKGVTSKYLIKNIELSFEAWNKIPKNKKSSFDDFCNYILPYKDSDEPIEVDVREKLAKKYAWVYKYLKNGASLRSAVDSIKSEFRFTVVGQMREHYPIPLSISQIEKSRMGICDDGVNYLVNVFRSLGIISAKDMISHWGNHYSMGHSWIYVKYGEEEYSTDVSRKGDVREEYLGESIPKVNRVTYGFQKDYTFSPFAKDVTAEYVPTVNITINNILNAPHSQPVLYVFDRNSQWAAVSYGKNKDENNTFNNVGVNVLYLAGIQEENTIMPINYPFFIDSTKKIQFFRPSKSILDSAPLVRKYGLTTARTKTKLDWMTSLNDNLIQGADNQNFRNAKTLYRISNFNSTHLKKILVKQQEKFRYVRYYSNKKESFLVKLAFYGANGKELKGEVVKENNAILKWEDGAFDDDPGSYSGGRDFTLGLKFKKPTLIHSVGFQARNDSNHINIGDEYELFYWDRQWKTLGSQVAKDTVLYYSTPANSLLWLKDNTNGKEEHVFTIDKNKKQRWLGFDNY